jgi:branched-subunit amino acid ABC-type transport system permease component
MKLPRPLVNALHYIFGTLAFAITGALIGVAIAEIFPATSHSTDGFASSLDFSGLIYGGLGFIFGAVIGPALVALMKRQRR